MVGEWQIPLENFITFCFMQSVEANNLHKLNLFPCFSFITVCVSCVSLFQGSFIQIELLKNAIGK